ncbi:COX8 domain-containing protein [Conger conger]|nr:COX8 domain-containing protein [Conger conger]XP_061097043.1 COX8 domain-containing protein [Conger conger]
MFAVLSSATWTRSLVPSRTVLLQQRPHIYSGPPKQKIGPGQSFFIMSVFAITVLAPAGWIMHHIPEYRQRPNPPPK